MKHRGKKYQNSLELFDRETLYSHNEAVDLAKQTAKANFDETISLAIRLGVDPRHADQLVRGAVVLPHGTGRTVRVLVFAKGDKATEAKEAGADIVGDDDIVERIQSEGWLDFDIAVATPDMMGSIGKIARILGPQGLMPNPKSGTVTDDLAKAIEEIKAGKVEYRVDRHGIINVPVGKASFESDKLVENIDMLMDAIVRARPSAAKGTYIRSVVLSATMGPGIRINGQAFMK